VNRLHSEYPGLKVGPIKDIGDLPLAQRTVPRSLAALSAVFLGAKVDKKERRTNWERQLTDEQLLYAATDAWASLVVYERILAVQNTHHPSLR